MPLDISDFPMIVGQAFEVHGQLGDRFVSTDLGLLYLGKDYASFPMVCKYAGVSTEDESLLLSLIQCIDAKAVKKSLDNINKAASKLKATRSKNKT